jgi:hypothetical protein
MNSAGAVQSARRQGKVAVSRLTRANVSSHCTTLALQARRAKKHIVSRKQPETGRFPVKREKKRKEKKQEKKKTD